MLTITRAVRLTLPRTRQIVSARTAKAVRHFASARERKHFEQRVVPFTPAELYDVVADVDNYKAFVPWCTASKVTAVVDETHVVADLSVGFRVLSETYSSVITLDKHRSVKVDVPRSNLFEYLVNDWYFEKGKVPNSTALAFHLRFAFRNSVYQRVTDLFFEDVVKQMVSAFEMRCHSLYGARPSIAPHLQRSPHSHSAHHHGVHDALCSPERHHGVMHRW